MTAVAGLDTVPDLKIKDAARVFGKKFSSGMERIPQIIYMEIKAQQHRILTRLHLNDYRILCQRISNWSKGSCHSGRCNV